MPRHPLANTTLETDVRFESMRGLSKNAQILRRHTDLRRAHEQQIRALEKETRQTTSEMTRAQFPFKKKLEVFEDPAFGRKHRSKNGRIQNRHQIQVAPPKLQREKKEILLFRVEKRNGKDVYIKEAEKKPTVDEMFAAAHQTDTIWH